MSKLVLISLAPATSSGGVPRWNRDFMSAFQDGSVTHYSWNDLLKSQNMQDIGIGEWDKARALNNWLIQSGKISKEDIIVVDGFWGLGLEQFPNVVSVCHGNWSHTTKADTLAGIPPEFPANHAVQLEYRKKHLMRGGRLVACSSFIADECKEQWNMEMPVINNGIDLSKFVPADYIISKKRPVIIHGVTNTNKGTRHIKMLEKGVGQEADVVLLDDAARFFNVPKYRALAQADIVAIPSMYEGFCYFAAEAMACDVPIISYDVGLMRQAFKEHAYVGRILERSDDKTPEKFGSMVCHQLFSTTNWRPFCKPREWVSKFSIENFRQNWKDYLKQEFGFNG